MVLAGEPAAGGGPGRGSAGSGGRLDDRVRVLPASAP
jgi:hypothetical protein